MKRCIILVLTGFIMVCCTPVIEAKTFVVTTFDDSFVVDGSCSLREAIAAANGETVIDGACGLGDPGADIIDLPPGTYWLMTPPTGVEDELWGDLDIHSEIELNAYSGGVTIKQETDVYGYVHGRVLDVWPAGRLTVRNITITAGESLAGGGGILNSGFLHLDHVSVTGNTCVGAGGGIERVAGSALYVYDSTISGNTAMGEGVTGGGGGIYLKNAESRFRRSTVSGNETYGSGGGFLADSSGILLVSNTTISGNNARVSGGGIFNSGLTVKLSNVTVIDNTANSDDSHDNDGYGGGIVNLNAVGGTIDLWNTMTAGNTHLFTGWGMPNIDCAGELTSQGYNLVGQRGVFCTILGAGPDQIGIVGAAVDPLCGVLANNSGPTDTHALLIGSPAINGGNPAGWQEHGGSLLGEDQRGYPRPSGGTCDIGAFEDDGSANTSLIFADTSSWVIRRDGIESD